MTNIELTEWEHQPNVLKVLTSKEMGAWLGRRDNRLLQEIRQEIAQIKATKLYSTIDLKDMVLAIIDKHMEEHHD